MGATLWCPASPARTRPGRSSRTAALQIDHDWVGGTAAVALIGNADSGAANPPVSSGGGGATTGWAVVGLLFASLFAASWRSRSARSKPAPLHDGTVTGMKVASADSRLGPERQWNAPPLGLACH